MDTTRGTVSSNFHSITQRVDSKVNYGPNEKVSPFNPKLVSHVARNKERQQYIQFITLATVGYLLYRYIRS